MKGTAVAAALALAACGRETAAPSEPVAPAPSSPFALPVLEDDGVPLVRAPLRVPLVPEPVEDLRGIAWDRDPGDEPAEFGPEEAPPPYPDARALLAGLDLDALDASGGVATFSGADAAGAGAALAAAHAALTRTSRVEVVAVRRTPGAPPPSAEAVLSARGASVLARIDRVLRDGTVLADDAREVAVHPARADVEDDLVVAQPVGHEVGTWLAASPAPLAGGRGVLRLAFHRSAVVAERRFGGDAVERVAPAIAVAALVADVPAPAARAEVAWADGTDAHTSFAIAWRVTPRAAAATSGGARAYPLFAERPAFTTTDDDDAAAFDAPDAFAAATGARLAAAEPGLLVATGDDAALGRADAAFAAYSAARTAAARWRGAGASIPFVLRGRVRLVQQVAEPFVGAPEGSVAMENASAAGPTGRVLVGRSLTLVASGAEDVAAESVTETADAAPRVVGMPRVTPSTSGTVAETFGPPAVRRSVVETRSAPGAAPELEVYAW